jgi:arginine decarboxylase
MDVDWSSQDSAALYKIAGWGQGMFEVGEDGHLHMKPPGYEGRGIDLERLANDMRRRGIGLPVLVRFTDIIRERIAAMVSGFDQAIRDWEYQGQYRPVFPVKVNPQSHVVHDIMRHGRAHHVGLEAGSKPELMVVLALLDDTDALIVCNGYKDEPYIRMALLARKLGHEAIIVLEKPDELDRVLAVAAELGVKPVIGIRAKLAVEGLGHWGTSTGARAKFGLTVHEMLEVVNRLRDVGALGSLQPLHFHIGSQIPDIRAIREGTRIYAELHRLGADMRFLDVGGGLGVDYDGSASRAPSSVNYDVAEYANAVVGTVYETAEESGAPHPHLITESGRSMVAHHAVLLMEVLGRTSAVVDLPPRPTGDVVRPIEAAWEIWDEIEPDSLINSLHDVQAMLRDANTRFSLGLLDLEQRATIEQLHGACCQRILELADDDHGNDELDALERRLTDTYFCNFSVFQSLPDVWAIDQLFPIAPIHRLDERPTRRVVIADLTCDSDGKIDQFIGDRDCAPYLQLHDLQPGQRYTLGAFMVGAYQEILGDLHNLFGDTHAVHVELTDNRRGYTVVHLDEGDIIEEVMSYVHHEPKHLVRRLRAKVEAANEERRMSLEDGAELVRTFVQGLDDYTYLRS